MKKLPDTALRVVFGNVLKCTVPTASLTMVIAVLMRDGYLRHIQPYRHPGIGYPWAPAYFNKPLWIALPAAVLVPGIAAFAVTALFFAAFGLFRRCFRPQDHVSSFRKSEQPILYARIILITFMAAVLFGISDAAIVRDDSSMILDQISVPIFFASHYLQLLPYFGTILLLDCIGIVQRLSDKGCSGIGIRIAVICDTAALGICLYMFLYPYSFTFNYYRDLIAAGWKVFIFNHIEYFASAAVFLYYGTDILLLLLPRKR